MSEPTRRSWLVTIGCAGLGLGVAEHLPAEARPVTQLPPGLYGPSSEHLGHALMSSEPYHPIPPGCPTDYVRSRNAPFTPLFFTRDEFARIRALVHLVLGDLSPSPGAQSQEVAEWIDLQVMSAEAVRTAAAHLDRLSRILATAYYGGDRIEAFEKANPETLCRDGLKWLENAAQQSHGKDFLALPPEQQVTILTAISDERADKHEQNAATRFFAYLKTETVRGFYTSQVGLKELDFKGNAFYARSPGCDNKKS